jgi:glycerol-3-phosphate dehydrogenase (NAD(P)+)
MELPISLSTPLMALQVDADEQALVARAKAAQVEMPIAEAMADLLSGALPIGEAMMRLMSRPLKAEA